MLVLTRKTGQRIMIGDEIEVAVLSTSGDKVRLGITAGDEVPIYREEVYRRIEAENETPRRRIAEPEPEQQRESVDEALQAIANGREAE